MFFLKACRISIFIILSWIILLLPAAPLLQGQHTGEDAVLSESPTPVESAAHSDFAARSDSGANHVDSLQDVRIDELERRWSRRVQQLDQAQRQAGRRVDSLTTLLNGLRIRNLELERTSRSQAERMDDLNAEARKQQDRFEEYRSRLHSRLWAAGSILLALLITAFLFVLLRSERTRQLLFRLKTEFKRHRKEQRRELKRQNEQQRQEIKKVRREQRRRIKQQRKEQRRELSTYRKKQRKELKDQLKKK